MNSGITMRDVKYLVVIVDLLLVVRGCSDLANTSPSSQVITGVLGSLTGGLAKIIVDGTFVLAVVHPDPIEDFVNALTGRR